MRRLASPPITSLATLSFDERVGNALQSHIQEGDPLGGRYPRGASYLLPKSGDGGETQDYGRQGHEGGKHVENVLRAAELGEHCYAFSDGMRAIAAATTAATKLAGGDRPTVLLHRSVYGGTHRFFSEEHQEKHISLESIDLTDPNVGEEIRRRKPTLIVGEPVTNPLLDVVDLKPAMEAARDIGATMILDNTLTTGRACIPLQIAREVGFDKLLNVLSLTKAYTAGTLSGAVLTDNPDLAKLLFEDRRRKGGALPADSAASVIDGFKSMDVRLERMTQTTMVVLEHLSNNPVDGVEILHPFVAKGRQRELANRYLVGCPAVFTLRCHLPEERYQNLLEALSGVFLRANSFNGHYPMMSESSTQSHASVKDAQAKKDAGVEAGIIRLSGGSVFAPQTILNKVKSIFRA
jgi:cystathionine beta-lyase